MKQQWGTPHKPLHIFLKSHLLSAVQFTVFWQRWLWRVPFSERQRRLVPWKSTDISEEHVASTQHEAGRKRRLIFTDLHGVVSLFRQPSLSSWRRAPRVLPLCSKLKNKVWHELPNCTWRLDWGHPRGRAGSACFLKPVEFGPYVSERIRPQLYCTGPNGRIIDEWWIETLLEGSGRGPIKVLSPHFRGETEENHKNYESG
jgi:hypothetical protein